MRDLYEIMGLQRTATLEEIEKTYKKLAKAYHPDRNIGVPEAESKFKELQNAYEILSDASKRNYYDRYGQMDTSLPPPPNYKPYTSTMDDLFSNIFGARTQNRNTSRKGQPITVEVVIDFQQALNGGKINIEYERRKVCGNCKGAGAKLTKCVTCNGTGYRMIDTKQSHFAIRVGCDQCEGTGQTKSDKCESCQEGYSASEPQNFEFNIPPGVEDGMRFIHYGLGEVSGDGVAGDLIIQIKMESHSFFERGPQGTVFVKIPVTYTELVLGTTIDIPTVDGVVAIKIPEGTQSGSKLRLRNKGLPVFNNTLTTYERGDQIIQVVMNVPSSFSEEYKQELEKLAELEKDNATKIRQHFAV